jgi:hypothetical protein
MIIDLSHEVSADLTEPDRLIAPLRRMASFPVRAVTVCP